jgi:fatty-acid desaturase
MRWYEFDFNWYTICVFKQLGLVSHIHDAPLTARTNAKLT